MAPFQPLSGRPQPALRVNGAHGFLGGRSYAVHPSSTRRTPSSNRTGRLLPPSAPVSQDSMNLPHESVDLLHDEPRDVAGCVKQPRSAYLPFLLQVRFAQPSLRLVDRVFKTRCGPAQRKPLLLFVEVASAAWRNIEPGSTK